MASRKPSVDSLYVSCSFKSLHLGGCRAKPHTPQLICSAVLSELTSFAGRHEISRDTTCYQYRQMRGELRISKNKTQWGGGQGVGGKMKYDPCLSYEMHPSVVTPRQIKPFFFFPPYSIIQDQGFHIQLHAYLHIIYTYTFTHSFERWLSGLTWSHLASYAERLFESPLQKICC